MQIYFSTKSTGNILKSVQVLVTGSIWVTSIWTPPEEGEILFHYLVLQIQMGNSDWKYYFYKKFQYFPKTHRVMILGIHIHLTVRFIIILN